MNRLVRRFILRAQLRSIRRHIEDHEHYIREAGMRADALLQESRRVEGELFQIEYGRIFDRRPCRVYTLKGKA